MKKPRPREVVIVQQRTVQILGSEPKIFYPKTQLFSEERGLFRLTLLAIS